MANIRRQLLRRHIVRRHLRNLRHAQLNRPPLAIEFRQMRLSAFTIWVYDIAVPLRVATPLVRDG